MKSKYNPTCRFFLILTFICVVSIGTAAAQPAGRLVVLRSPNFGWNAAFNLKIDGTPVATVVTGRHYHAWLPTGQHLLTVHKVPSIGYLEPTSTIVNVQPGWTHIFTAMWDTQRVYLHPSGAFLTPGAVWQNLGRL